ncbi:hypothetical protein LCGC14_1428500 [marine sediment metagenome]|uniref:Uncharacterized protein n=1 Tax=marine sediment metagenome TaxID=412755 RepID=A0A0F9KAF8_9ZZZZ
MSWDGKKIWLIHAVEEGLMRGQFKNLEEAELSAERLASEQKATYLVFESVSGFKLKENTERITFKK